MARDRDAEADLAVCAGATPGPWMRGQDFDGEYTGPGDNPPGHIGGMHETTEIEGLDADKNPVSVGYFDRGKDADFAVMARKALPYWIRRALKLEAGILEIDGSTDLRKTLKGLRELARRMKERCG